jgi:hypothetical protein
VSTAPEYLHHDAVMHWPVALRQQTFLCSGTWIRTRRGGLTVRSFAVNGHRNEVPRPAFWQSLR